jgi:hypothetical protein
MSDDTRRTIRRPPVQFAGKPPALPVRTEQWQLPVRLPPRTPANDPRQLPFAFPRAAAGDAP